MCNNNGHCRKFDAGTMCPSYRVTRDEVHSTRGRANTLRLAVSGQLGPAALASPRILVPLLENHQTADGRVKLPKAMQDLIGGEYL